MTCDRLNQEDDDGATPSRLTTADWVDLYV